LLLDNGVLEENFEVSLVSFHFDGPLSTNYSSPLFSPRVLCCSPHCL